MRKGPSLTVSLVSHIAHTFVTRGHLGRCSDLSYHIISTRRSFVKRST